MSRLSGTLHMCEYRFRDMFKFNESNISDGKTTFERVDDIRFGRLDVLRSCSWAGEDIDCRAFKPVMTERGACFSFNVLNSKKIYSNITSPEILTIDGNPDEDDWSMEQELERLLHSHEEKKNRPNYPYHLVTLDDFDSLDVELSSDPVDWYWNYKCEYSDTRSFKVFLHRSDEIKEAFYKPFEIEVGKKVIVSITPNVIVTSKNLEVYSSQIRRCYYNSERKLKYFQIYTKSNCEFECFVNFTIAKCGCAKFSMPRERDTRVCDVYEMDCYAQALSVHRGGLKNNKDTDAADFREKCNCISPCADIQYIPQSNDLKYVGQKIISNDSRTILSLSFKKRKFLVLRKDEASSITNRLATCGGILGLFMGISLLSLIEMIVYCVVQFAKKLTVPKKTHLNLRQKRLALQQHYIDAFSSMDEK
ncbi:pickpocket protein 28-like [Contarinia nasturtii]|uniref:pickpocket protein 28-like n=1 Tax=Contarinia nasturtii TaxID=265458 RepID=UPI0012D39063|nr:pickpocket protein 28-like [Contarinia nasturtii]